MEFPGKYYWKLTDNGVASGYPRRISSTWKELPSNIDAAFTYRNGKTYFFKVIVHLTKRVRSKIKLIFLAILHIPRGKPLRALQFTDLGH